MPTQTHKTRIRQGLWSGPNHSVNPPSAADVAASQLTKVADKVSKSVKKTPSKKSPPAKTVATKTPSKKSPSVKKASTKTKK